MSERQRRGWGGYRTIRRNGKFVYTHRWVMEEHLGRPLRTDEHVHHINGDRKDNRLENLEVVSPAEHVALHRTGRALKPELRARIVALRDEGLSHSEIGREVGIVQSAVTRHLQREQGINLGRWRPRNQGV